VPEFSARTNIKRHEKRIEVLEGDGAGSVLEAMSSDARKGHGLAPSLWIYDEIAQVDDFELLDNLETGMGKRNRSLGLIISTQAESDDHRLSI
jgi:phage terminase large subunit-like protein